MAGGNWMRLHDVHVRLDRSDADFWEVARCLANLFDVPNKAELDEDEIYALVEAGVYFDWWDGPESRKDSHP